MANYRRIEGMVLDLTKEGEALFLPVPVMMGGHLYDVFGVYAADFTNNSCSKPYKCLCVRWDDQRATDLGDPYGFAEMDFEETEVVSLPGYAENVNEARSLYGQVRDEAAAGEKGEATKRYFELIRKTSQPCLLPYYRALGAEFDD